MRFTSGLALLLIGMCTLDCRAKPTDADADVADTSSNLKSEKTAEDDSDMLMEPDEFSHISVVRSEGHQIYPATTEYEHFDDISTGYDSHSQAAQNFYPPFFRESPPLGHSRPYYSPTDGPQIGKTGNSRSFDASILGSGDFGVIRGGTFYSDDDTPYQNNEDNSEFNQFFGDNANNGHGRPQADAYVQKFTYPEEQFANFRDFADINTPSDSAYSQFVVVYANKNSTSSINHPNPKNIFEQLELLDREKALEEKKNRTSKTKEKLASTKLEKKYKKKLGPKDLDYEPLLALS